MAAADEEIPQSVDVEISAKFRGPGPARYGLPTTVGFVTHDPRKLRHPAYSFGSRLENFSSLFKKPDGPGPSHYINPTITRTGKDGTPHYSLQGRARDLSQKNRTPGPGTYSTEVIAPVHEKRPAAYSFGARTRLRACDKIPAPNNYSLPQIISSKPPDKRHYPQFSLTGRSEKGCFSEDLAKTPGPAHYDVTNPNIYHTKRPVYTLVGRTSLPGDATKKPGPGSHNIQESVAYLRRPQPGRHTIGVRHSEYITPLIAEAD